MRFILPHTKLTERVKWVSHKHACGCSRRNYLFPVRALSRHFRGKMVSALREAYHTGQLPRVSHPGEPGITLDVLMEQDWVVYSRPGVSEPQQVLNYLARIPTAPPSVMPVCCRCRTDRFGYVTKITGTTADGK